MSRRTIVAVEDDATIAARLRSEADLVVLDWMLPGFDELDVPGTLCK